MKTLVTVLFSAALAVVLVAVAPASAGPLLPTMAEQTMDGPGL